MKRRVATVMVLAAAELGIAQPGKVEPEPEAEERWPVDPRFPEDEGGPE